MLFRRTYKENRSYYLLFLFCRILSNFHQAFFHLRKNIHLNEFAGEIYVCHRFNTDFTVQL